MEPLFEREDELVAVGRAAAEQAWAEGMTVLRPDGAVIPIPLLAGPEVLSRAALSGAAVEAERILSASVKLARALLGSGDARDRAALEEPFSGLEAEAMGRLFEAPLPALVGAGGLPRPPEGGGPSLRPPAGSRRARAQRHHPGHAGLRRPGRLLLAPGRGPGPRA